MGLVHGGLGYGCDYLEWAGAGEDPVHSRFSAADQHHSPSESNLAPTASYLAHITERIEPRAHGRGRHAATPMAPGCFTDAHVSGAGSSQLKFHNAAT